MIHGTNSMYNRGGCRCELCTRARSDYMRGRFNIVRNLTAADRRLIAEALQEICPEGLTDDCPARSHVR